MNKPRANIVYDIRVDFGTAAQELPYAYTPAQVRKVLKANLLEVINNLESSGPDYFPVRISFLLHVVPPKELQQ